MKIALMNIFQQMFWAIYVTTVGIATPERLRRIGLNLDSCQAMIYP